MANLLAKPLIEILPPQRIQLPNGEWREERGVKFNFHDGQKAAFKSTKLIVAIIAGSRCGKTAYGPIWLYNEMIRKGPGDYLVVAPSYQLIDTAAGPKVQELFGTILQLGNMRASSSPEFLINKHGEMKLWGRHGTTPSRILFRHADAPEQLEGMTVKAVWCDEAGQKRFKMESWEAIMRRRSVDEGRILITSTPYGWSWMKTKIYDEWKQAKDNGIDHEEIDVFQFPSTMNPMFSKKEDERARRDLPEWKYLMMHHGEFT